MEGWCAFVDESRKPLRDLGTGRVAPTLLSHYAIAAAIVIDDLDSARSELSDIADRLGCPVHYNNLGHTTRAALLDEVAAMTIDWACVIAETSEPVRIQVPDRQIRDRTLATLLPYLAEQLHIEHTVLESRGKPGSGFEILDDHDHRTLQRLRDKKLVAGQLRIEHRTKDETLLALADIVAGARTDHLCHVRYDLYPRIAHRATILPC